MSIWHSITFLCGPLLALLSLVASPSTLAFHLQASVLPSQFNCGTGLKKNRGAELAPHPRPVLVGIQFTHIGGRRVPVGSLLVTDRLKESDLKPHIARYKHADRSDELIVVKRVDKEYLRTIGRLLDQAERDTKSPEKSVVRVVLIWGDDHQEYYLTPEDATRILQGRDQGDERRGSDQAS